MISSNVLFIPGSRTRASKLFITQKLKQAGAELGQAQVKLEVVDEGLAKA